MGNTFSKTKRDKTDNNQRILASIGGNKINKNSTKLDLLIRWSRVRISDGLPNKTRD
ncbi:MAG: hypothetical protein DHS20C13_27850 [Thermodesulfobacteriota bacterium]|nr:MAG: hypothetical protein DHS20C13_27850 [Thermodesulfobacteriota bacterium]